MEQAPLSVFHRRYAFRVWSKKHEKWFPGVINRWGENFRDTLVWSHGFSWAEARMMARVGRLVRRNWEGDRQAAMVLLQETFPEVHQEIFE